MANIRVKSFPSDRLYSSEKSWQIWRIYTIYV